MELIDSNDLSNLSRIDLIILKELKEQDKTSFLNSKNLYDFTVLQAITYNNLYKRLIKLEKLGYLEKGLKESKKNTYFITKTGITALEKIN